MGVNWLSYNTSMKCSRGSKKKTISTKLKVINLNFKCDTNLVEKR